MTALAEYLRDRGDRVSVVSAFEGLASLGTNDARWGRLRDFRLERLAAREHWAIRLLVRIKQALRGVRLRFDARGLPANVPANPVERGAGLQWIATLRRIFFSLVNVVDDQKKWSLGAARRVIALGVRSEQSAIVVSGPPMSTLFGALSAGRKLRIPVIVDLRDPLYLEPGAPMAADVSWERWARRALERHVARRAAAVVTTSPSLRDMLRSRYPAIARRIVCIPNGFDGQPAAVRTTTDHRLVMVYAGTLYLERNPFPLLEALECLLQRPDVDSSRIEVVFAGDCEEYGGISLRGWLATRPCGRVVSIHGPLSSLELRRLYERATVLLNFAERQPMQVPAKTFELLALGREVLVLCESDSDTASVIGGLTGTIRTLSGDTEQLRHVLLDLYQRHVVEGRLCAPPIEEIGRFSRTLQNERFAKVIDGAIEGVLPLAGEEP